MARKPLETTEFSKNILKKVNYTHDAMIDEIIANPGISEIELAERFGFSRAWVTRLICSDAFQSRLALRKEEVIDPTLVATVEERLRGVTMKAIDVLQEKLEATGDPKTALRVLEITTRAQGYGARPVNVQNNTWVVPMPPQIPNAKQWEAQMREERGLLIEGDKDV